MPANVEFMASANGIIPWHEIGFVFAEGEFPDIDAMLRASRTDTEVGFFHLFSGADAAPDTRGDFDPSGEIGTQYVPDIYAVRRQAPQYPEYDGTLFGVVRSRYRIFQNRDVAEFGELVLAEAGTLGLNFQWETMGTLNGGSRYFATLKMPEDLVINGTDHITRYLLLTTAHDGSKPFIGKPVNERVVCNNTLTAALREHTPEIKIRHTVNMADRVSEAVRVLGLQTAYQAEFAAAMERLAATSATESEVHKLMEDLIPIPADGSDAEQRKAHDKQLALVGNWHTSPTVAPVKDTRYGAWQAVTEAEQWTLPRNASKRDMAERRTEFAFFGSDKPDALGQRAFELLTADWDDAPSRPKRQRQTLTNKVA
jgi:phage/plasmid-like protein (TIGR03299 family)